jgi:molecular chaperone DnaK (HSP70)
MWMRLQEALTDNTTYTVEVSPEILRKYHSLFCGCADPKQASVSKSLNIKITRSQFEVAIQGVVDVAVDVAFKAVKSYWPETSNVNIDEVILVGGSSHVPLVRNSLRQMLSSKLLLHRFSLDGGNQEFC